MDLSPDKDTPGCYTNKFTRSSFSSHSDVSEESRDEKSSRDRDRGGVGVGKGLKPHSKKEQGYSHLERASSEEELFEGQKSKSKKSTKVFGKLKTSGHKNKTGDAGNVADKFSASHQQKKHSKGGKRPVSDSSAISASVQQQHSLRVSRPVFGLPLAQALKNNPSHDGVPVPAVVRHCIDYVNEHGLRVEGIYRLSPSKSQLDELRLAADQGRELKFSDVYVAAALLKLFLRELADPLLTHDLQYEFEQCVEKCKTVQECVERMKKLFNRLPAPNRALTAYLFIHMHNVIENCEFNKMNMANIGLMLQPVLNVSQSLLSILLQQTGSLFADFRIKKYIPPIKANSANLSMEFPNNIKDIKEELAKQESLLNYLHEDIKSESTDPGKDEQLWDVQRLMTQLNRELKKLMKQVKASPLTLLDQASTENQPAVCLETFEEKQLLAVQMQLNERIENEEKLINDLKQQLRLMKEGADSQQSTNCNSRRVGSGSGDGHVTSSSVKDENDKVTEEEWIRRCEIEEERGETLLAKIVEERHLCARLRAQLEMYQLERQEGFEATRL